MWDEDCQRSFEELKAYLTTALIVRAPNWQLLFEVMCDASDLTIGAVLGQREKGIWGLLSKQDIERGLEELHHHREIATGSGLCFE